ncbi:MAG: hypothetical protein ABI164_02295, partial [Acidobacteriaceae bacterium]
QKLSYGRAHCSDNHDIFHLVPHNLPLISATGKYTAHTHWMARATRFTARKMRASFAADCHLIALHF